MLFEIFLTLWLRERIRLAKNKMRKINDKPFKDHSAYISYFNRHYNNHKHFSSIIFEFKFFFNVN